MSKEHIPIESLEWDDTLDEEHLESCGQCQKAIAGFRFLRFQLGTIPRIEPPKYFARRVAKLAEEGLLQPFTLFLERAARQLIPALVTLTATVTFLFYYISPPLDQGPIPLGSLPEEVSLKQTVDFLRLSSEGGWILDQ